MDRGFLDFERPHRFHQAGSFFVTRGKANLKVQRRYSRPVGRYVPQTRYPHFRDSECASLPARDSLLSLST